MPRRWRRLWRCIVLVKCTASSYTLRLRLGEDMQAETIGPLAAGLMLPRRYSERTARLHHSTRTRPSRPQLSSAQPPEPTRSTQWHITMQLDTVMQIVFGISASLIAVVGIWYTWHKGKSLHFPLGYTLRSKSGDPLLTPHPPTRPEHAVAATTTSLLPLSRMARGTSSMDETNGTSDVYGRWLWIFRYGRLPASANRACPRTAQQPGWISKDIDQWRLIVSLRCSTAFIVERLKPNVGCRVQWCTRDEKQGCYHCIKW